MKRRYLPVNKLHKPTLRHVKNLAHEYKLFELAEWLGDVDAFLTHLHLDFKGVPTSCKKPRKGATR